MKILSRGTEAVDGSSGAEPDPQGSFRLPFAARVLRPEGLSRAIWIQATFASMTPVWCTRRRWNRVSTVSWFTYALPLQGKVMMIVPRRTLPTDVLDILVEEQSFAATSDLQLAGRVSIEPHVFTHFRGCGSARAVAFLAAACPASQAGSGPANGGLRPRRGGFAGRA